MMPGALGERAVFGAKLISVFPENFAKGVQSHQGLVVTFDPESGAPTCIADAGEITAISTAAASAVATDVLASLRLQGRHRRAGHGWRRLLWPRPSRRRRALGDAGIRLITRSRASSRS